MRSLSHSSVASLHVKEGEMTLMETKRQIGVRASSVHWCCPSLMCGKQAKNQGESNDNFNCI